MRDKETGQEFINEKQTYFWGTKKENNHWMVDNSLKSFNKLLKHLEVKTNFRLFFEEAFERLLKNRKEDDLVVLCGAFHHCHDEFIPKLFDNIDSCLKNPYGKSTILIANEHVVNKIWEFKRVLAFFYNRLFVKKEKANRFYGLKSLRIPHPDDGEHWRSKREIDKIFEHAGYVSNFCKLNGNLCAKK